MNAVTWNGSSCGSAGQTGVSSVYFLFLGMLGTHVIVVVVVSLCWITVMSMSFVQRI